MTRFSRQSGCTRSRLDTSVSRRILTAIAVRRLPLSPPSAQRSEYSGLFCLGRIAEKGECTYDDALLASVRLYAVMFCARFAARQDSRLGRIAKRFSGGHPFPCALSSALFRCCYGGGLNGEAQPSRSY